MRKLGIISSILVVVAAMVVTLFLAQARSGLVAGVGDFIVPETFWQYQCLDTMKFSRDVARQHLSDLEKAHQFIENELSIIKNLGANCVAIGTPYDAEFLPILKLWVSEAREQDLSVWFRGNFSGWEGWFDYAKFASPDQHNELLYSFILNNKDLFKPWDILTPVPEAENGILGNPWRSADAGADLRRFVESSTQTCLRAQAEAGVAFRCGYFSANGDVAERIYDAGTAAATGGVIVMDHYVSSAERMERDIVRVAESHKAQVMLGEFGGPIPDINGPMTEDQQAELVGQFLDVFRRHRNLITGINYWVLRGGSTGLINEDGSLRKAATTLASYYKPGRVYGQVLDSRGRPVAGADVTLEPSGGQVSTNASGQFGLPVLAGEITTTVHHPDYAAAETAMVVGQAEVASIVIKLYPLQKSASYRIEELLYNIGH